MTIKKSVIAVTLIFSLLALDSYAQNFICPDPDNSSLKWGVIPKPWIENPYSSNHVQGESGTRFSRANIMVAGLGRGVVCTYKNSVGLYSIWWPVRVKIPARVDYNWIETLGGFVCTQSLTDCIFSVAIEER